MRGDFDISGNKSIIMIRNSKKFQELNFETFLGHKSEKYRLIG